jgi:tyrosine-specific transport protein
MEISKAAQAGNLIGATLLVAGTSIGGGMLALPVATSAAGFFPSLTLMTICWAFMTTTALLLLEVNLWMKEGSHIISMSSRFLGPIGKGLSWIIFLFMGYASLVAYISEGGGLVKLAIESLGDLSMQKWVACLIFIGIFGLIIDFGAKVVGRANAILMIGMIAAYAGLIAFGFSHVKLDLLLHQEWNGMLMSIPIVLTVFSFQCIVPSLTIYLHRNGRQLRMAIIGGTTITFIIYVIWEFLVLGTVPLYGPEGLAIAHVQGTSATEFYRDAVGNHPIISYCAAFFAFFAIASSFLGIGLSLFDFLSDGLKIKKQGIGKYKLAAIIIIPSLLFAVLFERAFLVALDTSGGFGDSILNGILPALMVWAGRYHEKLKSKFSLPGGKGLLTGVILFSVLVIAMEILQCCGMQIYRSI